MKDNDGEPIRVATVKRGDQWYVSLFYTIADNATHAPACRTRPPPTDRRGGQCLAGGGRQPGVHRTASSAGDLEGVIAVLPPDEMGVLHDYGKLLIDQAGRQRAVVGDADLGVTISDVTWDVSDVTGGKKVSIESMTVTADGQTVTITRDAAAGSLTVTVPGEDRGRPSTRTPSTATWPTRSAPTISTRKCWTSSSGSSSRSSGSAS